MSTTTTTITTTTITLPVAEIVEFLKANKGMRVRFDLPNSDSQMSNSSAIEYLMRQNAAWSSGGFFKGFIDKTYSVHTDCFRDFLIVQP